MTFRALLEGLPDAVAIYDDERRYLEVNRATTELLGARRGEIVGRRLDDFVVMPVGVDLDDVWRTFLRDGKQLGDLALRRSDGQVRVVEVNAVANFHGKCHLAVLRDIADSKRLDRLLRDCDLLKPIPGMEVLGRRSCEVFLDRAERELGERERAQRALMSLIDAVPDAIVVSREGRVVFATRRAAELFGHATASDLCGRHFTEFSVPEESEAARARCAELAAHKTSAGDREWGLRRPDGTIRVVEASSVSVHWEGVASVLTVLRDVTERRQHEAQLRAMEAQLRQAQKMEAIGRLAGGVAHDFNNMLGVILGWASILLEDTPADDPRSGDLRELQRAAQRSTELTSQLLAFSRQQVIQPRPLQLDEVLRDLERMLRRVIGEDIELSLVLGERTRSVLADRGQIDQALMNLVVNARDSMPRGGRLTIEAKEVELDDCASQRIDAQPGPHVCVVVRDTGTGMTSEVQSRLFEPFFTTKEYGRGTGLGLATVFGIVKQHGGAILVDSVVGRGSTFELYFPVAPPTSTPSAQPPKSPSGKPASGVILLVEDEAQFRQLVRTILGRAGYRVLEAACAAEALAILDEFREPIDLLLTDVVMPVTSGRDLADQVRTLRPTTRLLFMSGYTNDTTVDHDVAYENFLQKPFTPDVLLQMIRDVLAPD